MTTGKTPKTITDEERIAKLERYADVLRWHLINTLEQSYTLAAELAIAKGKTPETDETCNKLQQEFAALNTLRPINQTPRRY